MSKKSACNRCSNPGRGAEIQEPVDAPEPALTLAPAADAGFTLEAATGELGALQ